MMIRKIHMKLSCWLLLFRQRGLCDAFICITLLSLLISFFPFNNVRSLLREEDSKQHQLIFFGEFRTKSSQTRFYDQVYLDVSTPKRKFWTGERWQRKKLRTAQHCCQVCARSSASFIFTLLFHRYIIVGFPLFFHSHFVIYISFPHAGGVPFSSMSNQTMLLNYRITEKNSMNTSKHLHHPQSHSM